MTLFRKKRPEDEGTPPGTALGFDIGEQVPSAEVRRDLLLRELAEGSSVVAALRYSETSWAEFEALMQDPEYTLRCLQTQDQKLLSRALRLASLADSAIGVLEQAVMSGDRHVALELLKELAVTSAAAQISAPRSTPEPRPRRLLLVEDEAPLRDLITTHFRRRGFDVEGAGSAEEVLFAGALADVYAKQPEMDCLLLDVNLPGLSGVSLARIVHDAWPQTPIVFITGDADLRELGRNEGEIPGPIIGKPFEMKQLDAAVDLATDRGA